MSMLHLSVLDKEINQSRKVLIRSKEMDVFSSKAKSI